MFLSEGFPSQALIYFHRSSLSRKLVRNLYTHFLLKWKKIPPGFFTYFRSLFLHYIQCLLIDISLVYYCSTLSCGCGENFDWYRWKEGYSTCHISVPHFCSLPPIAVQYPLTHWYPTLLSPHPPEVQSPNRGNLHLVHALRTIEEDERIHK